MFKNKYEEPQVLLHICKPIHILNCLTRIVFHIHGDHIVRIFSMIDALVYDLNLL